MFCTNNQLIVQRVGVNNRWSKARGLSILRQIECKLCKEKRRRSKCEMDHSFMIYLFSTLDFIASFWKKWFCQFFWKCIQQGTKYFWPPWWKNQKFAFLKESGAQTKMIHGITAITNKTTLFSCLCSFSFFFKRNNHQKKRHLQNLVSPCHMTGDIE